MNTILEEAFLYDGMARGIHVGFITAGQKAPTQAIGYIVTHETLGAVYVAYACHPTTFLTPSHLKTIANRLKKINEQA